MIRIDLLSIIRSFNTVFTATGICHNSYVDCLLNLRKLHLVGFYYKNISRCTVLWMSNSYSAVMTRDGNKKNNSNNNNILYTQQHSNFVSSFRNSVLLTTSLRVASCNTHTVKWNGLNKLIQPREFCQYWRPTLKHLMSRATLWFLSVEWGLFCVQLTIVDRNESTPDSFRLLQCGWRTATPNITMDTEIQSFS